MPKRLTDRIAEKSLKAPSKKSQNQAVFLIYRDEIQEALNDRWSQKKIWETLIEEEKIDFCYQTFLRLTNRLITKKNVASNQKKKNGTTGAMEPAPPSTPMTQSPNLSIEKKKDKEPFYRQRSEEELF